MAPTMEILERACSHMQQLDFEAVDCDRSITAFETFRRAVTRVVRGARPDEHCILENIEQKKQYFRFLLDFAERCFLHRRRVGEVLKCLLDAPSWHEAARADPEMWTALQDLICQCQVFRANTGHGKRAFGLSLPAAGGQPIASTAFDWELAIPADQRVPVASASVAAERDQALRADQRVPSTPKRTADAGNPFLSDRVKKETGPTPDLRGSLPTKTWVVPPGVTPVKTLVPQTLRQANLNSNPFKTSSPISLRTKASSNPFATLLTSRSKGMDDRICCTHNPFASSTLCARVK